MFFSASFLPLYHIKFLITTDYSEMVIIIIYVATYNLNGIKEFRVKVSVEFSSKVGDRVEFSVSRR